MRDDAKTLATVIERMASAAKAHADTYCTPGWWVLLCGEPLDPDDFDKREIVREELAEAARELDLTLAEHVWVWDDRDQAQLVVGRHATYEQALEEAERLTERVKALGRPMAVRVMEELREGRG